MAMTMCCSKPSICGSSCDGEVRNKAISQIDRMLNDCMAELQTLNPFGSEDAASISGLVYDSMSAGGRVYHDMQHVFDISTTMKDPILILSALFHDVIYYSIDQSFSAEQQSYLAGVLQPDPQRLILASEFSDPLVDQVVKLYGFTPGAELPKSGTNEFLSGMIAVRILSKWLANAHLMEIVTCIEATIPFRPVIDDKTPMDRLYDRLKLVCPDQSDEWLVETVQKAAATANCDLCSFDCDDRDFFLDSSWRLIPEARPILLQEDCPLIEWLNELHALQGRSKFLKGAVPRIFQSFRQVPSDADMEEKQRKTHENLAVVCEYVKVRLLQAMMLVDFVEAMGEDASTISLRSCLKMDFPAASEGPSDSLNTTEKEVRHWLVSGRRACFSWDPAISPLGAYLFDSLGSKGVAEAIEIGSNKESGTYELLKYLPKSVVLAVASQLGAVFTDRAERFLQVPEKLDILAQ